jgi:hypothetical protein
MGYPVKRQEVRRKETEVEKTEKEKSEIPRKSVLQSFSNSISQSSDLYLTSMTDPF